MLEHDIARPSLVRRGVNRDLEAICLKALQKQPSRRYSGADEMAQDLRSSVAGRPVMARRYPPWEFLRRAISYRKEAFLTGLATVLLMQLRIQWSVLSLHATASAELFGGLRRQVTDLASLASQMIDPRHVAAAMARGATQGAEVEGLEAALDKVVQRSPDLRSVWIVRSTSPDGKTMQILAQSVPSEADAAAIPSSGGSPAGSGQPFDASLHPELLEGLQGPTADKSYRIARDPKASDQRGVGLSGYAPVLDQSGRSIAVLGVDVSKADLDNRFAELDRKLIAPLVLSAVLSLVATALIVAALAALWGRRK